MNSGRLIGIVLLVLGLLLLFFGFQSSEGLDDQVSEALTGEFTDSTMWFYILGTISSVAGAALLLFGKK